MNPLLFLFELLVNFILWPIYFVVVCVGYVYDLFACKKVPTPRKIVITGASSGMGACSAIEYAETVMILSGPSFPGSDSCFDGPKCRETGGYQEGLRGKGRHCGHV